MFKYKFLCFIVFVGLLIYMSKTTEGFVNGTRTTKYVINILSKDEGEAKFNEFKNTDDYNKREINARTNFVHPKLVSDTGEDMMLETYKKNVMEFTEDEKQYLTDGVNYLFTHHKNKLPLIRAWNFIKLHESIDWGYPFTLDNYIVLSSKVISGNTKEMARLLFHEQLHIIQRNEKKIFSDFYVKQWKFKKFDLPNDPWINKYLVHNPDSKDYFIYKLSDELYLLPLATTHSNQYRLTESALFLTSTKKILAKDDEPHIEPLRNVKEYNNRFYNAESLYHPNEIFATILTSMVFNELSVSEIDTRGFDAIFLQLKNYF